MSTTIGFIGAGQMGEPMVSQLLRAGHHVIVYVRRKDVRERLRAQGAYTADSVADLAQSSDILISCLFSDSQLRAIGLGPDGIIDNARPGAVFVSHTTGALSTLTALRDSHRSPPVILDAPVSGTVDNIVKGTLTVLIGGPSDAVSTVSPALAAYADPIIETGGFGSAMAIKLINNVLFCANAQLLAAAMKLGDSLGADEDALLSALQVCSGGSQVATHVHRIGGMRTFVEEAGRFLRKDIDAALEAAWQAGAGLGLLGAVVDCGPLALRGGSSAR